MAVSAAIIPDATTAPTTPPTSRLAVLLFTDIVGSTELKSRLGAAVYARLLTRHDSLFKDALAGIAEATVINDTGDGYLVSFATASDAVRFALRMQRAVHVEPWEPQPLRISIGVHLGEITQVDDASGRPRVIGLAIDLAGRLTSLASAGQILLTRTAFDEARQFLREYPPPANGDAGTMPPLRWIAHGEYRVKGADEALEVFEVGGGGIAPLAPPPNSDQAKRMVSAAQEETLGWRPAVGLEVPERPNWIVEAKLGEGTFGEVWLAHHARTKEKRVFKFCFDLERLHSFKRELTFFRLLRTALGERRDIARLYDVRLDQPPFFLESEYAPGGNLVDWAEAQGGLSQVPMATRLEIVAKIADAVAAAHSVGILHKDIKPHNILLHFGADGALLPQLGDFGIGLLVDRNQLAARQITELGFTGLDSNESSRTGTRMYAPPESLTGRPFTTQGDIYALGVLLYQSAVGDLERPLATGWEREVADELVREDIAACVDGDAGRRLRSAAELGVRLRALPERRDHQHAMFAAAEQSRRRRRLLRVAALVTAVFIVLGALAIVGFVRERRLRVRAEASERSAQLASATSAFDQGTALHLAGRGLESRDAFLRARDGLGRLGRSTLDVDAALYRSLRGFEPPVGSLARHRDRVMTVAWVDDERAVSAGDDRTIILWDVPAGRRLKALEGHTGLVACLAVSRDKKLLLSGGQNNEVKLWDIADGKELYPITPRNAEVRGAAFSPDGKFALWSTVKPSPSSNPASGASMTGVVELWDIEGRALKWTFAPPEPEGFYGVAFSPDGARVVAGTYQNAVWLLDAASGRPVHDRVEKHEGYVIAAAFATGGKRFVTASLDSTLKLWDGETVTPGEPFIGHTAGVRGATFVAGDAGRVLSCSMDGTLRLWNSDERKTLRTFAGHVGGAWGVAVSPDGRRAISGGIDQTVKVWDLAGSAEVPTIRAAADVITALSCSDDGLLVAVGDTRGVVTLRDGATLRTLRQFAGLSRPAECVRLVADARRIVAADDAGNVVVWDIVGGGVVTRHMARAPTAGMGDAARLRSKRWCYTAISPDGRVVVSSTSARTLDVWSLDSGRTILTLGPMANDITCVAVSPDGGHALCGDDVGLLYHWNLATGEQIATARSGLKLNHLDSIVFAHDGRTAATAGHDRAVRLWDLRGGGQIKKLAEFDGHTDTVRAVAFGPGGRTVYSAGNDETLRLREVSSERDAPVALGRLSSASYALATSPAGDVVIVASGGDLSAWDVSRVARHLDWGTRLATIRAGLDADPPAPTALATLGEWYAFRGMHDWAATILERARAAGAADVASLTLARCYWHANDLPRAAAEFRTAISRGEAPEPYLRLCLSAVTPAPSTPAVP